MLDSPFQSMKAQLAALLSVSRLLTSSIDLPALLNLIVKSAEELLACEASSLFLVDQTGQQLVLKVATGPVSGEVKELRLNMGEGIAGWVATHRQGLIVNDAQHDPRFYTKVDRTTGFETRSVLAVPLVDRQQVVGVLQTLNTAKAKQFDQADLELLTAFSAYAAVAVRNANLVASLQDEHQIIKSSVEERYRTLIVESPSMQQVVEMAKRAAQSDTTVLLLGESGVGKEILARSIHNWSPRAAKPFVAVNCVALSDHLLESELFGHEKGAFTGAHQQKKGLLEVAQGGTLFLDEIGDMKPSLQAKLLRVLQDREFERVGGTQPIKVDIHVLAATNQDLQRAIAEGRFRTDLFFRLNVISLVIPPLRERRDDIPTLTRFFVARYAKETKRLQLEIHPKAIEALQHYAWPGNVRELANIIERAVVLAPGDVIAVDDLSLEQEAPDEHGHGTDPLMDLPFHESVEQFKRQRVQEALVQSGGSKTKAAQALELQPSYLSRLCKQFNIS
ncbi:MAG TPA: sigma 54-interacting transcriptional regulator [Nitrospira sp.]|nr:sigma 54-interacting transcriptional regulator [Nitrospira sp.]